MAKEIAVPGSKAVAKNDPWSKAVNEVGFGDENTTNSDIIIPRFKIVQALTKNKEEGWKDGDIVEVVSKKNYGNKVNVVALLSWKSRVFFTPEFTMRCKSDQGKVSNQGEFENRTCETCEHSQWPAKGSAEVKPACDSVDNFAIIEENDLREVAKSGAVLPPIVLPMSGASAKQAKMIKTAIRMMTRKEQRPMFSLMLELETHLVPNPKGDFYAYKHKIKSLPAELAPYLISLFKQYKAMKIDAEVIVAEAEEKSADDNTV